MDTPFGLTLRDAAEQLYAWKATVAERTGDVFRPSEWLPTIKDLTNAKLAGWSWGPHEWAAATGAVTIEAVHTILDALGFPVPSPESLTAQLTRTPRPVSDPGLGL